MARLVALLVATLLGLSPGVSEARRKPRAPAQKREAGDGTMKLKLHESPSSDEPDKAPRGGYAGVTLQGGEPPPTKPPPPGLQAITWPGFRADSSGSEVFLQLTGQVTYDHKVKGRQILITLEKTVVPLRNNLRPVITRNFNSPVSSFRLRPAGADKVRLEITLRRKVEPAISLSNRGKYTFLVVAFAPPASSTK